MRTNQLTWLCLGITLLVSAPGCVAVAAGAGVAGGYAAGKYQVSGEVRGSYEKVWDTALAVLRNKGSGVTMDERKSIVKAVVQDSQVHIRLNKRNPTYTRVRIRAWREKDKLPNEKLALRLFGEIQDRMEARGS